MINIQYKDGAHFLNINPNGSWIDLYLYESCVLEPGEFALLDLGVAMKLPEGYEAIMAPRSSTFKKYGILQANSIGIIDPTYCGPNDWWKFPALNLSGKTQYLEENTRLCQFRILPVQKVDLNHESILWGESRGGFGTSGD